MRTNDLPLTAGVASRSSGFPAYLWLGLSPGRVPHQQHKHLTATGPPSATTDGNGRHDATTTVSHLTALSHLPQNIITTHFAILSRFNRTHHTTALHSHTHRSSIPQPRLEFSFFIASFQHGREFLEPALASFDCMPAAFLQSELGPLASGFLFLHFAKSIYAACFCFITMDAGYVTFLRVTIYRRRRDTVFIIWEGREAIACNECSGGSDQHGHGRD